MCPDVPLSFPIAEEGRLLAGEPHRLGRMQCAPGGVGRIERVGAGRLAFDHAVVEGMTPPVDWTPATGTYQVNPDCTGQAELNIPGNPLSPLSIRFVIADEGNLLLSVLSEPWTDKGKSVTGLSRLCSIGQRDRRILPLASTRSPGRLI